MPARGLVVALFALFTLSTLACGTHRGGDISRGPKDLAAYHQLSQDKDTVDRASWEAPDQYYDAIHYYRIAEEACERDPGGVVCISTASLAHKSMAAAVDVVNRRDHQALNKEKRRWTAMAARQEFASLQQEQQQEDQQ